MTAAGGCASAGVERLADGLERRLGLVVEVVQALLVEPGRQPQPRAAHGDRAADEVRSQGVVAQRPDERAAQSGLREQAHNPAPQQPCTIFTRLSTCANARPGA